ncbi:hypothetical protein L1987_22334 [Smallanthus sonchifolius]|uniref:Uncharacterized protein n=1 Tax=Smallanthus sonchifolius TaxID=185202 RepID=A0ACB9IEJ5_9ASTR|nr:hypothetical protein L1987_22334 [Smallanthus sonchifolius]
MAEIVVALELSLTLQNKFDSRVKPATGMLGFARMFKLPFISPEVNSAQSDGKPSTINDYTVEHNSSPKDSVDRREVVPFGEMLDRLKHIAGVSSAGKLQILAHDLKMFSLDDLKKATKNFKDNMRLGEGEFGEVFEGYIDTNTSSLVDGLLRIAIRRFNHSKIQRHLNRKFVDMRFLRNYSHPNLVKVLGYCFEDGQLFLIYEFMENGSLDSHLSTKDKMPLPWKTRVQIIVGIAEALSFLHTTHKDFSIKLHQIFLDKNFSAKISDIEAAKLADEYSYKENYIDPLFYHPLQSNFLDKSEVRDSMYAFGVVLFQILTGEHVSKIGIANLRQSRLNPRMELRKESLWRAMDPRLPNADDTSITEAFTLAGVALNCLNDPFYTLSSALGALRQL